MIFAVLLALWNCVFSGLGTGEKMVLLAFFMREKHVPRTREDSACYSLYTTTNWWQTEVTQYCEQANNTPKTSLMAGPRVFQMEGLIFLGQENGMFTNQRAEQFRGAFGIHALACSQLWQKLQSAEVLPENALPKHLLWALFFLKNYATETVGSSFANVTKKTFRKWCWILVRQISELDLVRHKVIPALLVVV